MKQRIKSTKAFIKLEGFQKTIYGTTKQISEMQNNYSIAKKNGIEFWTQELNPCQVHKRIVLELLKQDENG